MPDTSTTKASRTVAALLIGLAATGLVLAAHLAGVDRRAELLALDFRFRHLSPAPNGEGIVVVEIDDRSLEVEGRWPWPRQRVAAIARILRECGAQAVALDIILEEPQPTRYVSAATDAYDPDTAAVLGSAPPRPIFDDAVFREALADGAALLPMTIVFGPKQTLEDPVVEQRVREALEADPDTSFRSVLEKTFPDVAVGKKPGAIEEAKRIYWRLRGLRALGSCALPPGQVAAATAPTGHLYPPFVLFAPYCARSGFVSFPRELDGVMRRIPMLARCGGEVYPQFALALSLTRLAGSREKAVLDARGRTLNISLPDGSTRTVPLDADGNLLINWTRAVGGFESIPARSVGYVWRQRRRQEGNLRAVRLLIASVARIVDHGKLRELFAQGDKLWQERIDYEANRQRAALFDPKNVPPDLSAEMASAEDAVEKQIDEVLADLLDPENADFYLGQLSAAARKEVEAFPARKARRLAANREIQEDIDENVAKIREKVAGKICLVGSSATGAADFVPTPVAGRMPGVMVHANIFNTLVSGAFMAEAHPAANIAAILLAGAVVSLAGARLSALRAGPAALALAVAYAAGNCFVVFLAGGYWLVLVAPLAAMVASFLAVTAYRQVTEEREKRHIRGLFAHAMSPELVDQLLEDPSLLRLGGKRRVLTSFFSDLAGFTSISERLGEQDTVRVLNRYFDRMEEVQARTGGYVNKFLGDGLLVLFGAPVLQDDRAQRALGAAVACQDEVARLDEMLRGELGDWVRLSCRVGVATGPAVFGDCGSTNRADYTAIGNCVNLSSRLESANKQFGTKILVDDETWSHGGSDAFLARPLGGIVVVGQTEIVRVWNVAGRAEDADGTRRETFADFARAVELYEAARFEEALKLFEAVADRLASDGPAELYLALCRQHLATPPAEPFDPTIRLTEK